MKANKVQNYNLAVRIARRFASIDVGYILISTMFVSMALAMFGIMLNTHDQAVLFQTGSAAAFNAHTAEMMAYASKPLPSYLLLGLLGQLPSGGDNFIAAGIVGCFVFAPTLAGFAVYLRGVFNVRVLDDWALAPI